MSEYNPIAIEQKWRKIWQEKNAWKVDMHSAKRPYYNLMMFPYPSAEGLHIGNVYAFTGADIHGRFRRMQGYDVFEPMGFDAFGIHSENFAIKKGVHPLQLTEQNVARFRGQLEQMGALFDWDYAVNTSKPEYYKWTQWLFLQMFNRGLAYRAKAPVDWCPSCKTVLAHEQVIGGHCERCDTVVVQKELEQWFFKITDYADRLLKNLETIDWSEGVKLMQKNWIGKSEGAEIKFQIPNSKFQISVFTTRPDTLFGATYMVLAPEHEIISNLKSQISNFDEIEAYIRQTRGKTEVERMAVEKEKTGVELKGIKAINPANKQEIPVWIADYVLKGYGTGAIMAVPAHDRRDFEFAKKYGLPIYMVVCPHYPAETCPVLDEAYQGKGHLVASGQFNGMSWDEAKEKIIEFVGGQKKVQYHLRDWLISRQRYWGPPIPVIYCEHCRESQIPNPKSQKYGTDYAAIDGKEYTIVPVPEDQLPVELPYVEDFKPTGTDKSPLASVKDFVRAKCPRCGGDARRETDVSDTFLDSAWYFLRYPSIGSENSQLEITDRKLEIPWNEAITRKWLPVHMYIGGKEHAVLHLLYARFVTMVLHDMGLLKFEEPFAQFRTNGLLIKDGAKMSKSRGNVINPDDFFASWGVDVTRMYLMFLGPFEQGGDWHDEGIRGIARFAKRVWELMQSQIPNLKSQNHNSKIKNDEEQNADLERIRHKTIKRVTEDTECLQYNTAIAALMEYVNALATHNSQLTAQHLETLVLLMAPLAPHLTEELWHKLGHEDSVHDQAWPLYDEKKLAKDIITIAVQINGKTRGTIEIAADMTEDVLKQKIVGHEKFSVLLGGASIEKWIIVPGRLVNIVIQSH